MNFLVIGAGMMGRAVAYDLARYGPGDTVFLADIDPDAASHAARQIGQNVTPLPLDANNASELRTAFAKARVAISAASYSVNDLVTRTAISAGVHLCDLGGNNDVVDRQLAMDAEARDRGVIVIPNCGLAPGLINVLAVTGAKEFDELDSIRLRVGGLPLHPRPPLNYQLVFSAEGLLNEYIERASVIRDGQLTEIDSMTDLEEISFPEPFGALEAFSTSGGISTLTRHFQGTVRNLDYKTIRYKGHCERFRTLLDLGFASSEPVMEGPTVRTSREFFTELLRRRLDFREKDVVLARATIAGRRNGTAKTLAYECVDYYDDSTGMTAMMRTTSFPTAIIARMIADGTISARGVMPPELCVPGELMISELARRDVKIVKTLSA